MRSGDDFPCVVSGRVTARAKKLMNVYGFSVRDAVEWFVDNYCNPKKKLEVDKFFIESEISALKFELECKEKELDLINKEIDSVDVENG